MPLPPPLLPKPPDEEDEPERALPELLEPELPREPAETDPALRAALDADELATDDVLLPAEAELT